MDRSLLTNSGTQSIQLVRVGIFQAVLILRPAYTVFDCQILNRLHVQRDSVDLRQLPPEAGG